MKLVNLGNNILDGIEVYKYRADVYKFDDTSNKNKIATLSYGNNIEVDKLVQSFSNKKFEVITQLPIHKQNKFAMKLINNKSDKIVFDHLGIKVLFYAMIEDKNYTIIQERLKEIELKRKKELAKKEIENEKREMKKKSEEKYKHENSSTNSSFKTMVQYFPVVAATFM